MEPGLSQSLVAGIASTVLGLVAGSFLATVAVRWPQSRKVGAGRSACDSCNAVLGPVSLVPVLSYLAQRGRCRACRAKVDPIHPVMELVCGAIGAASQLAFSSQPLLAIAAAALGWQLALVAALDWRALWLPDRLTMLLLVTGLLAAWIDPEARLITAFVSAAGGFLALELIRRLFVAVRRKEGMGRGDPKLFGAIGAWIGWQALSSVLLAAAVLGIAFYTLQHAQRRTGAHDEMIPFGAMLAAATWPIWLWSMLT